MVVVHAKIGPHPGAAFLGKGTMRPKSLELTLCLKERYVRKATVVNYKPIVDTRICKSARAGSHLFSCTRKIGIVLPRVRSRFPSRCIPEKSRPMSVTALSGVRHFE